MPDRVSDRMPDIEFNLKNISHYIICLLEKV